LFTATRRLCVKEQAAMGTKHTPEATLEAFAPLRASGVALLTSFRRDGRGVGTPVGIRVGAGKAYFTTWSTTGKVKRLARNPRVTLAPCTRRGRAIGPTLEGTARRLEGAEADHVSTSVLGKTLWGRLWGLIYRLRGWQPVLYEVAPVAEGQAADDPTTAAA
jgi:PPOX class probable F420-dependent enzyme